MLTLCNVSIFVQDFGTVLGVFLRGAKENIINRYYSFWNWGATGGELEWWTDSCALFWIHSKGGRTADERLFHAMAMMALFEILNKGEAKKGTNPYPQACKIAEERISQIKKVTWFKIPQAHEVRHSIGQICAEKGTGNFNDDILGVKTVVFTPREMQKVVSRELPLREA